MANEIADFYDQLAEEYHLIFADWKSSILYQSEVLHKLIQAEISRPGLRVLDCSCGIGTQSIGMALKGYKVHATDLSRTAVERLQKEAISFGVSLTTGVADFRELAVKVKGQFDVVISCDNSLPHLLTDEDMRVVARNLHDKVQPGGLLLVSIRDYEQEIKDKQQSSRPNVIDGAEGRRIVFQVWDWASDSNVYTLHHFIVRQDEQGAWQTVCRSARYRAWQREELVKILNLAGFIDIEIQFPQQSGYYQPILSARKQIVTKPA